MMLANPGVFDISIRLLKLRITFDGKVGFVGPHREEKRLIWITLILQPTGGLIRGQRSGESGKRPHFLAIADKVFRILVGRRSIILGRKPPVVPVVIGLGLFVAIKVTIEMPLPTVHRFVACFPKKLGRRDFGLPKMGFVSNRQPTPNPVPVGRAAG